jgi:uncharacterized protein YgfB (UPF0149 family)
MTANGLVGHDDIDALIMRLRLGTEASELHGSLCGFLAGGGSLRGTSVLAALQLDGEVTAPSVEDQALLTRLARQCEEELADPELGFEPLLPEDDLGTVASSSIDFGNESEDEDALIEVQEFVRVAAMLLHTECTAHDPATSGTIH